MPFDLPNGKAFAFSIFDDTDVATLDYIRPVYGVLRDLGIQTTKSVWPLACDRPGDHTGSHTLQHPDYAAYMTELQSHGFEIGFHGATMETSNRQEVVHALELFHDTLGAYPRTYAAHARNRDNLYWGIDRVTSPWMRKVYSVLSREPGDRYQGHVEGSEYFWGDLAKKHLSYVRSFTFRGINLRKAGNTIVYSDPAKKWVNNFFISCDAENVEEFNRLLRRKNQEKLERQRGICIVSTHFGKGFTKDGDLRSDTRALLEQLSRRNGWFVPVSVLLDHITGNRPAAKIRRGALQQMERRWLFDLLARRVRRLDYEKTEIEYLDNASKEDVIHP